MFNMSKNKKILLISSISLAVIIVLGIVYAAFTQQLNIAGSATGRSSKWDIHFENLSNVSLNGTAKELTAPTINTNSTQISNYSVSLTSPGDYVEYTFDVVNDGDYDATLTNLSKTAPSCQGTGDNASNDASNVCGKLTYTLTYSDGTTVSQSDTLASKETKTMKLKLLYQEFNDDSLLPKMDVTISGLGITLTYTQNGNAKVNANGTTPFDPYPVGGQITVAGETYHILSTSNEYVIAIKDDPLTVTDLNTYGAGHVNMYIDPSSNYYQTAYDFNDVNHTGGMAYYTSVNCGSSNVNACTTSYESSEVKYVVDAWAQAMFQNSQLKTIDGYATRLITVDEINSIGFEEFDPCGGCGATSQRIAANWLYSSDYAYWTMTPNENRRIFGVSRTGVLDDSVINGSYNVFHAVRPVINVYKSKITS